MYSIIEVVHSFQNPYGFILYRNPSVPQKGTTRFLSTEIPKILIATHKILQRHNVTVYGLRSSLKTGLYSSVGSSTALQSQRRRFNSYQGPIVLFFRSCYWSGLKIYTNLRFTFPSTEPPSINILPWSGRFFSLPGVVTSQTHSTPEYITP